MVKNMENKAVNRFDDIITVKGSDKHPTLKGKEFKVHRSQMEYLKSKGYIADGNQRATKTDS